MAVEVPGVDKLIRIDLVLQGEEALVWHAYIKEHEFRPH